MSKEQSATLGEGVSWNRLPVMTGMTFGSDCIVNGVEVKAGTVIKFETPGAHRSDLADLLWTLYEGLYGHRKAENIDPFKTAVGGALEVKKAWDARSASAPSETAPLVAGDLKTQREIHDSYAPSATPTLVPDQPCPTCKQRVRW